MTIPFGSKNYKKRALRLLKVKFKISTIFIYLSPHCIKRVEQTISFRVLVYIELVVLVFILLVPPRGTILAVIHTFAFTGLVL